MTVDSKLSVKNTWGVIPFGSTQLQVRQFVLMVASGAWIGLTWLFTGTKGISAFALNAVFVFVLGLVAYFAATTVTIATTTTFVLCGGALMGVAGLLGLQLIAHFPGSTLLPLLQAPMEELLKILPLLVFLVRGRKFTNFTLGATDILLLGVACGAGFAFVEDAYIHKVSGWAEQIVWLPSAEIIGGRMIAGHALWTGLAASTIGLALLYRHNKLSLVLAGLGSLWAIFDHIANNYAANASAADWTATFLKVATINGWATPGLFVLFLIASVVSDRFVLFKTLPKLPECKLPSNKTKNFDWLDFILDRRRLAYAFYRYKHAGNQTKRDAAAVVAILMQHLINSHKIEAPAPLLDDQSTTRAGGLQQIAMNTGKSADDDPNNFVLDLPDRYQVMDVLNEGGGMGLIYRARHKMTNAMLAIKVMRPHLAKQQVNLLRFEQEAKAASALKHPNLVVVHDYGLTKSEIPYLVMDLIEGTSLQQEIKENGPLPIIRFLNIFTQASDALGHAHKRGVIHRDIKPSNMILAASDSGADFIRIVDFGIAKVVEESGLSTQELTRTGDLIGSPLYMSPEQCLGTALDARSDIYSLGCVMYEALTGSPPLLGTNTVQTIFKHIHEMPSQPSKLRKDGAIPNSLEQVLFKTLQKEPNARFASMEDLRNELESIKQVMQAAESYKRMMDV